VNRILLVIDNLEFGGGERGFLQLSSRLRDRFEFFVASTPGGTFQQTIEELGIGFVPLDVSRRISLKPIRQIRDFVRANKIDIIHSQGARVDFFARMAGRLGLVPATVSTVQMPVEMFDVSWPKRFIYTMFDRLSRRFVDRFIVVSQALKEHLVRKQKIPGDKISIIYNGVELDLFKQKAQEEINIKNDFNIPVDSPLIGTVGRLAWQKGFEYLIEAAPMVLESFPQARFLIVGEGQLKNDLIAQARRLHVQNNLLFTGFLGNIQTILADLEIFVLPSLREGFPMIILEAMAMSKPIVATQIQGVVEQLSDGKEGILVPPRNPEALASAILRLIHHREFSARLGAAARIKVEKCFSVEKMVRETEEVYLSLLKADGYKQLIDSRQG
jgi:glycosyltransferase involved in cell wall biosynthesis